MPRPPLTFPYFGGKGRIAHRITKLFPPHELYVEPFGGAGHVLTAKPIGRLEVYNDLNENLVTFFRVLQDPIKGAELRERLRWTPFARKEHELARAIVAEPAGFSDVVRAWAIYVWLRQGFGGNVTSTTWLSAVPSYNGSYIPSRVAVWREAVDQLEALAARWRNVYIECQDWRKMFDRYDSRETLFYCDPPYIPETRREGTYAHELTMDDHKALVERLLQLQGMAILSGYAHAAYEPLEAAGWE